MEWLIPLPFPSPGRLWGSGRDAQWVQASATDGHHNVEINVQGKEPYHPMSKIFKFCTRVCALSAKSMTLYPLNCLPPIKRAETGSVYVAESAQSFTALPKYGSVSEFRCALHSKYCTKFNLWSIEKIFI